MFAIATRGLCRLLAVTVMMLSFHSAWAGMIGTQHMVAAAQPATERAAVQDLLSRTELRQQLANLGVDPRTVDERVAALTDGEVAALAGKLDTLPAGGLEGWVWLVIIVIIAFMVWGSTSPRRR